MNIIQFAENIKIPSSSGSLKQYAIDDNNKTVLSNIEQGQREYITGDRGSGCTTLLAVSILYHILTNDDYRVGFVTTNYDMVKHINNLIVYMCESLQLTQITRHNKQLLQFSNGSRILFASSKSPHVFRGTSLNQLVIDNYEYITIQDRYELMVSTIPCISSTNGKLIIATTPYNDVDVPSGFRLNVLRGLSKVTL